jgi:alpha-L-fucosidase 2
VPDPDLAALYYDYGKYLLIGSSRPGTMPANLQGIWNWQMWPAWNADFHSNKQATCGADTTIRQSLR